MVVHGMVEVCLHRYLLWGGGEIGEVVGKSNRTMRGGRVDERIVL